MNPATDELTNRTRRTIAMLMVSLAFAPAFVSAQSELPCPELELGHPSHTLDALSFLIAVKAAPEAFRWVPRDSEPRPLLRPGCPRSFRMEGHASPDILPVLVERWRAIREHDLTPANLEVVSACLGVPTLMPPPLPDDPERDRKRALGQAWGRICVVAEQWMTVSLPRQSETDEDHWSVWVRATNGIGNDMVRVDLRWRGEGHEPEVLTVEWEWGMPH